MAAKRAAGPRKARVRRALWTPVAISRFIHLEFTTSRRTLRRPWELFRVRSALSKMISIGLREDRHVSRGLSGVDTALADGVLLVTEGEDANGCLGVLFDFGLDIR